MEKGKISALQMGLLLYPTIVATAILSIPSITAQYAGNDFWISPIFASLFGFVTVFIIIKLHSYYPGKTIIQYSEDIVGPILGKIISFLIILVYLETTGSIVRTYSEFIVTSFLFKPPQIVVIGTMIFLCAFTVYAGLEVIARSAQFLFPLFIFPLIISIILLAPDFKYGNILPILENGIMPVFKGAIPVSGWFAEFFIITFLLPFLINQKKALKNSMFSVVGVLVTLVLVNLLTAFILGVVTANKIYPLMNVTRFINLGDFIENMEAIVMAIWITGTFVKLSVFYYAISLGTAQLFNLSNYRMITWPLGILIVQFAYWEIPNMMTLNHVIITNFPVSSVFFQTFIPLLLLIVAYFKNKNKKETSD